MTQSGYAESGFIHKFPFAIGGERMFHLPNTLHSFLATQIHGFARTLVAAQEMVTFRV